MALSCSNLTDGALMSTAEAILIELHCLHWNFLFCRPLRTWAPPAMKALAFTGPATMDTSLASTSHSIATPTDTQQDQQQQQNLYSNIVPSFRRCRALVLDSSYRPIDVVNWQRAICLDLFDKAGLLCQGLDLQLYRLYIIFHIIA